MLDQEDRVPQHQVVGPPGPLEQLPVAEPSGALACGMGCNRRSTPSSVNASPGGGAGEKPLLGRSDRPMKQPSNRLSDTYPLEMASFSMQSSRM
jgi:hypothetical protein